MNLCIVFSPSAQQQIFPEGEPRQMRKEEYCWRKKNAFKIASGTSMMKDACFLKDWMTVENAHAVSFFRISSACKAPHICLWNTFMSHHRNKSVHYHIWTYLWQTENVWCETLTNTYVLCESFFEKTFFRNQSSIYLLNYVFLWDTGRVFLNFFLCYDNKVRLLIWIVEIKKTFWETSFIFLENWYNKCAVICIGAL